jgi:hypothetical protein
MFLELKPFLTMRLEGDGMSHSDQTWIGDWRQRIRERIHSLGTERVTDFLERHPAEPYFKVARRLGNDVAAVQLARMQFEEASDRDEVRQVAMDGFSREVVENLKRGWGVGPKGDAVWNSLKEIQPPRGWLPSGPNDPLIQAAFARGWPPHEMHQVQMASSHT